MRQMVLRDAAFRLLRAASHLPLSPLPDALPISLREGVGYSAR